MYIMLCTLILVLLFGRSLKDVDNYDVKNKKNKEHINQKKKSDKRIKTNYVNRIEPN